MTITELRGLKVGDKVRWASPSSTDRAEGEVIAKERGFARIRWADGKEELIGWRAEVDRARGKNIELLKG
jgi:hypothetical protein